MTPSETPYSLELGAAMGKPETKITELCRELGIGRPTLYRHVGPKGEASRGWAEASRARAALNE